MRATAADRIISGDMPGETVTMGLAADGLDHIMDILSDLYSDRLAAVIREYTTNALDSHAISGQTKPVEITSPSRFNNNLVIRDYGEGMSKETLVNVYSKYGASTKRDNDIETGRLGLGAKSAFAYSDQFTVTSIHNGYSCMLVMSKNDRGGAEMNIVAESPTDEPNGVTVMIPVSNYDIDSAKRKIEKFAKYVTPGLLLVNGEPLSETNLEHITDNLYRATDEYCDMIVMGNVAYRLESERLIDFHRGQGKARVAFVEMGAVDFTPSRESLKMTRNTKATIEKIRENYWKSVEDQLDKVDDIKGMLEFYSRFGNLSYIDDQSVRSKYVEAMNKYTFRDTIWMHYLAPRNDADTLNKRGSDTQVSLHDVIDLTARKVYVITNFTGSTFARSQFNKLVEEYQGLYGARVVLFKTVPENELLEGINPEAVIDWEEFKKTARKLAAKKPGTPRSAPQLSYTRFHKRRSRGWHKGELDLTGKKNIYYVTPSDWREIEYARMPREDFTLVNIPAARLKTFLKRNPDAKSLMDYVINHRQQLRKHAKIQLSRGCVYSPSTFWRDMNYMQIEDEKLREAYRAVLRREKWGGLTVWTEDRILFDYVEQRYPLLNYCNWVGSEHMQDYVNGVHRIREERKECQ